ncbi:hypothetical protein B5P44_01425 [Mycobacterium sp. CBMA 213]|uniref:Uncharacterized protein n=1 Tax=Mycolicibacterium sp. CBMA 213 TaxID=1968788 RepID=A0A343VRS7_9MYCO|nr:MULTISPECIES: hypothetical protein [unclassified Mycolicibacterium]AVN58601.1 hypothetical protein B5P44_p00314 [Mycolicibacterium sp. CBMA 213]MUL61239.1 hypothetical protein [Mycolicibacterium sp. CBMA 335]MUM03475.1 hypothetical protein [Mycolicibacterium sp. CBMA 213]
MTTPRYPTVVDAGYGSLVMLDVEATDHTPMSGVMTEFALVHVSTGASFYGHLYRAHPDPDKSGTAYRRARHRRQPDHRAVLDRRRKGLCGRHFR